MDILKGLHVVTFLLWAMFQSQQSSAQTFGAGYAKYQKGDFVGAESALTQALKKTPSDAERAKILKFRGISQFMLGSTAAAKGSFREALSLVPSLTIDPNDVLDDDVLELFNEVKAVSQTPESVATSARPSPAKGRTPKALSKAHDASPPPTPASPRSRVRAGRAAAKSPAAASDPRAQTSAPTGPDLATQFAMDAAMAAQPVPPPSPYGGYAPPGYAPGYYPSYGYSPGMPARQRYRSDDPDYLVLAFPFGAGQFHQDRYVAGLFFLATEGYGLYYVINGYRGIQLSKARQDAFRKANCMDPDISEEKAAECDQSTKAQEKFRSSTQTSITGASAAVFALILYGAADAIVKDPDFQAPPPPRRHRRTGEAPAAQEIKTAFSEHGTRAPSWHWHLALSPRPAYDGGDQTGNARILGNPSPESTKIPGILWNLEWTF